MATSGTQVDAWGAMIPNKGDIAEDVVKLTISNMQDRGLENLTVKENVDLGMKGGSAMALGETRGHTVFEQKLGRGGTATLGLRATAKGKDLELSWRLFESNWATGLLQTFGQTGLIIAGGLWTLISLFLIPLGVGVCMIIPGIAMIGVALGWWGVAKKSSGATHYQQFDSRYLGQAVDFSLMGALEEKGVTQDEIRVMQQAQMQGLGRLGTPAAKP